MKTFETFEQAREAARKSGHPAARVVETVGLTTFAVQLDPTRPDFLQDETDRDSDVEVQFGLDVDGPDGRW